MKIKLLQKELGKQDKKENNFFFYITILQGVNFMLLDGWDFQSRMPKWETKLKSQEHFVLREVGLSKEKLYKVLEVLQEYGVVE